MGIQQKYAPNFNKPEVYAFFRTAAVPATYDSPIPMRTNFSLYAGHKKSAGIIAETSPGHPLKQYWTSHEFYQVTESTTLGARQVVGNFDIYVPVEQSFSMEIFSILFIKDGIGDANVQIIKNAFDQYQWPASGDPDAFMRTQLAQNPTISASMFSVEQTHSLIKNTQFVEKTDQKDAILAIYLDKANGYIFPGPNLPAERLGEGGYFSKRHLECNILNTVATDGYSTPAPYPLNQADSTSGTPDEIVNRAAEAEGRALDCGGVFSVHNHRIMKLFEYPEFKVIFRDFEFDIGCGIHIVLTLPVLQIRMSEVDLYAYTREPDNIGSIVVNMIEDCAWMAALSGAVIGVVLGNFVAALAAFKAVFTGCIKNKAGQFIACLIPGLALVDTVIPGQDWHDV
jgi:hypothetical protein